MKLEGVFPAVATPFSSTGAVDYFVLERHLEFLASHRVHGFVPCATTGEGPTLNSDERQKILELSCRVADSHEIVVIAGCGGNCTSTVTELCLEARQIGCHGALVVTPYYNRPTQEGLLAHYRAVAGAAGMPIIMYNVPSRTNVNLLPETAVELFKASWDCRRKGGGASGNYNQWLCMSRVMDLGSKSLMAGDDDCFAVILALGGAGIISTSANVVPQLFVSLYDRAREGKWGEVFQIRKNLYLLQRLCSWRPILVR